jgi:hypothetical protein
VRTDPHRPGAIVPADYHFLCSYAFGVEGIPAINVDLARQHMAAHAPFKHPARGFGLGSCSVCGACFNYGDLWLHLPTDAVITLGHDCADKYSLMVDRSAFELEVGNAKAARAQAIAKAERAEARAAFLAQWPGLAEALACAHPIVQDIGSKLDAYGSLSEKQVALVLKLAHEAANPEPAEAHVPAPEGRVTFRGVCVSLKSRETDWGPTMKITVKVSTPEGSWLAWGTCPAAILGQGEGPLKGKTVEITATLKHGSDAHFALMSRPSGRVVEAEGAVEVGP